MSAARWIMAFLGGVLAVAAPDRTAVAQRRAPRYLDRVTLTLRTISTVEGHLVSRDRTAVGRELDALLKALETYRGKGLNDNAYWLLRANAQYLRERVR